MPVSPRHQRKGSTLLELMATISVVSILFVAGGMLLHRLLGVERTSGLEVRTQTMISRMSERWREDAHQAQKVERLSNPEKGESLAFQEGDREIVWQKEKNRVIREVLQGKKRTTWNDFVLLPGTEVALEYDAQLRIARLRLNHPWPGSMANSNQTKYEREAPVEVRIEGACRRLTP